MMTSTMSVDGRPIHFPGVFDVDDRGVIVAPPPDVLPAVAASVRCDQLMLFTTRLIRSAKKKRRVPRHAALNRSKLELARLCIERLLGEGAAQTV